MNNTVKPTYNHDKFFKILLMGDRGIGKTTFIKSYKDDSNKEMINDNYRFKLLIHDTIKTKLQIFEYCEHPGGGGVNTSSIRNAQCFLMMFDVCDKDSLESVSLWIRDVLKYSQDNTPIILIGNKSDLKESRQVNAKDIPEFIRKMTEELGITNKQIPYFELSSTVPNVKTLDKLFQTIYKETNNRFYTPLTNENQGKNIEIDEFGNPIPQASERKLTLKKLLYFWK